MKLPLHIVGVHRSREDFLTLKKSLTLSSPYGTRTDLVFLKLKPKIQIITNTNFYMSFGGIDALPENKCEKVKAGWLDS